MTVDLEKIFNAEGECREFDYSYDMGDADFIEPVHVSGKIYNKTGIVYLEAKAEFFIQPSCARCNKSIEYRKELSVRHILVASMNDDADDDLYIFVENMQFEPDNLISEDIYLALPSRFLCKDDCRGLCPVCGADLNETVCNCKKPADPRWAALENLTFE